MAKGIRNGQFSVAIEKEEPLWRDKKRVVLFGLPISFTKYTLTASKFIVESGFLNKKEEETRLYRITDVSLRRGFFERMFGLGTIRLLSSDTSTPEIKLMHIRKPKLVKDVLSQAVEECRKLNGVRTSEMVGTPLIHPGEACHDPSHQEQSALLPDMNHNGVDDRTE